MHIQGLDLNLLPVFDVLLDERSVTRAAARLGLSQSAVSHALNRLRHSFGDELFYRSAHGMTPTPRAVEIGPRVRAALAQLQATISPPSFDPATTERRFVLVAGPYACAVFVPGLVDRLAAAAPRAQLVATAAGPDLMEQLDARRADLALGIPINAPERVAHEALMRENLVWAVRADHPLTKKAKVSLEDLIAIPHIVIAADREAADIGGSYATGDLVMRSSWEDVGSLEAELRSRGLKRTVGVTVPDTYSAIAVMRRSHMAALIPRRLAELSALGGALSVINYTNASPPVDIGLFYLRERLAEAGILWIRDLVREVARGMSSPD